MVHEMRLLFYLMQHSAVLGQHKITEVMNAVTDVAPRVRGEALPFVGAASLSTRERL